MYVSSGAPVGEAERIAALEAESAALRELVVRLEARVTALEWELSRHSGNSSTPPSSDTVAQRQEQNQARESRAERRRKARAWLKELHDWSQTKRRPGKQPGGEGHPLERVGEPDLRVGPAGRGARPSTSAGAPAAWGSRLHTSRRACALNVGSGRT